MLVIRLTRVGKKNKALFRVIVQEKHRAPSSKAIEIVGQYNPHTKPSSITLKEERIKYWINNGAQPSPTVHNMLVNAGVLKSDKQKSVSIKTKKRKGGAEEEEKKPEEKKDAPKTETNEKVKVEEKSVSSTEAPSEEKPQEKSEDKKES